MKVILINGSRRDDGCTYTALCQVAESLNQEGIETNVVSVGSRVVKGEVNEAVKELAGLAKEADGFVVGSPVYYASPSGEIEMILDRLLGVAGADMRLKPAAAIASARRGGTTATVDALNKYFQFNQMPVVSSNYWNIVHGNTPEEVKQDAEGMQIMKLLGKNMAWMLKCIEAGKNAGVSLPEVEEKVKTNFIR